MTNEPTTDRETLRAYYLLQYERIAQHESGRLQFSGTVVAGSVVALGVITLRPHHLPLSYRG